MGGLVSCMPWRKRNNLLTGTVDEERMQTAYRRRGRAIKPTISRPIMNRYISLSILFFFKEASPFVFFQTRANLLPVNTYIDTTRAFRGSAVAFDITSVSFRFNVPWKKDG